MPPNTSAFTGQMILVVEDESLIALLLKQFLEELNCVVLGPANSVEAGLELISGAAPHAALLDVNLRNQRVTPLAQACRERGIPFCLVTGYGRLELDEPLLQAAPRVHKPFDMTALERVLTKLISTK